MKTIKYDVVIDSIGSVHGEYPGSVDVSFHREYAEGQHDGFENKRIHLTAAIIKADGSYDDAEISRQVVAMIGETETVELTEADWMEQVTGLVERAMFKGGDWRGKMEWSDALYKAKADIADVSIRAETHLDKGAGTLEHAVLLALKDRMESAADYYDSTGFDLVVMS